MIFPIALRTRNRPVYLDVTLKSIWATKVPDECPLVVIDDCSDNPISIDHLKTDNEIVLPKEVSFGSSDKWKGKVGSIQSVKKLRGLNSRIELVQPDSRKGVRGGIFWCIDYMMRRFPDAEGVIVIEADSVFHENWYEATVLGYQQRSGQEGPNGKELGLLSCYDRKGRINKSTYNKMGSGWRGISKRSNGRWNCSNGIGGVMYLVTRTFYEATRPSFEVKHNPNARAGDTMLQGICAGNNFNIGVTVPSFCQHIGIESLAWPDKGWRHAVNFKKPMAFEAFDENGVAYSKDWV
jgi:hypothetical protein